MNTPKTLKLSFNEDLRRISLINEYEELVKQIGLLFSLKSGKFKITYKDEEGDIINICTPLEYKEAINCCQGNILRLFITSTVQPRKKNNINNNKKTTPTEKKPQETFNPFEFFKSQGNPSNQINNLGTEFLFDNKQCVVEHNYDCNGCNMQIKGKIIFFFS